MSLFPSSWRGHHGGALAWSPRRGVFLIHGRRIGRARGPLLSDLARELLAGAAVFALGATAGGAVVWLLGVW